ncbi:MAG: hypothetical protein M1837_005773 [Sclerophora amabilis]|nr:MAG: hypothetical protein M1837_005773 [Sclerophora amabilis]
MSADRFLKNFNIPLQIQPQVFCALALFCWGQTLVYHNQWRAWTAALLATSLGLALGGFEVLLILTLRGPYNRGVSFPMTILGVLASVLLAAGLVPPYFEIWKRRGRVVGISTSILTYLASVPLLKSLDMVFLTTDWLGGLFSLMALVAQESFDVLGAVLYIICMVIEAGIFISHWIWLVRTRKVRKQAELAGKSYDDFTNDAWEGSPSGADSSSVKERV